MEYRSVPFGRSTRKIGQKKDLLFEEFPNTGHHHPLCFSTHQVHGRCVRDLRRGKVGGLVLSLGGRVHLDLDVLAPHKVRYVLGWADGGYGVHEIGEMLHRVLQLHDRQ